MLCLRFSMGASLCLFRSLRVNALSFERIGWRAVSFLLLRSLPDLRREVVSTFGLLLFHELGGCFVPTGQFRAAHLD